MSEPDPGWPATLDGVVGDRNGRYRGLRVAGESVNELISDPVAPRTIRPHLVRSGLFLLPMAVLFLGWILAAFFTIMSRTVLVGADVGGFEPQSAVLFSAACLAGIVCVGLGWLISLFLPLREPIAEYGVIIEGRAECGPIAFARIADSIANRRTPLVASPGEISGVPALTLSNGLEHGLITVRGIGSDLFVGWTMWRNRSTARLLLHILRDMLEWSPDSGPTVIRNSLTMAMRELLHIVTREGVQAASAPLSGDDARSVGE